MERPEAQQVSGTDWMVPYLMAGMLDGYDAIRLIAERAHKSLPNADPLEFDFVAPLSARTEYMTDQLQEFCETQVLKSNPALLIDEKGKIDANRFFQLMLNRNERRVNLQE